MVVLVVRKTPPQLHVARGCAVRGCFPQTVTGLTALPMGPSTAGAAPERSPRPLHPVGWDMLLEGPRQQRRASEGPRPEMVSCGNAFKLSVRSSLTGEPMYKVKLSLSTRDGHQNGSKFFVGLGGGIWLSITQ